MSNVQHAQQERIAPEWSDFLKFERQQASKYSVSNHAWGADDALASYLDAMAEGQLASNSEARLRTLRNRATNRAKIHARRRDIDRKLHNSSKDPKRREVRRQCDPMIIAAVSDEVQAVRSICRPDEWTWLWALANGDTCETLAASAKMSVSTFKSKVSRCRSRVRALLSRRKLTQSSGGSNPSTGSLLLAYAA